MEVSVRQATRELSKLINRALYAGEHITITSRGRPKAVLLSVREYERLSRKGGLNREALREARRLREAFAARFGTIDLDLVRAAREEREAHTSSVLGDRTDDDGSRC